MERRLVEDELRITHQELERLIEQRTTELATANALLKDEIAERQQAEAALQSSEWRYRMLFEQNLAGVFLSTLDGQVLDCNEALAKIFGYGSRKELLTHHATDFYFDARQREAFVERLQREGVITAFESCVRSKDGRPVWLIENVHLIEGRGGAPTLIQGTVIDITEGKHAEEAQRESRQQYESLVQSIDGIVWELDAQTFRFIFVSKQAERILGYPVAQWLEEPSFWADHLHPDDRAGAVAFCLDATARKVDHQFDYRMIAADGREVWLRDIVTVHIMADDSVHLRSLMVDITERKRAEEARRFLSAMVFEVEQACPYLDADGMDDRTWHLLGWVGQGGRKILAAYARVFPPGIKYTESSIGRVVTHPSMRRQGLGEALMAEALRRIEMLSPCAGVRIGAQMYLERFYEKSGFRRVSAPYDEDGIMHIEMLRAAPGN